jgi:hypothetical protein
MNTKGANLLLSTMLVASCIAAPAFADDTAKALPAGAPDASKEPAAPSKDDVKNIGTKRGIIIKSLSPISKPADTGKATTADNRGSKPANVKSVSNVGGSHLFGNGMVQSVSTTTKTVNKTTKIPNATKTTTTTTVKTAVTSTPAKSVAIIKSSNGPIQTKTVTKSQPIAKIPAKTVETVAVKHTTGGTKSVSSSGEQIVTAWLNKKGDKPHFKDGEKLQVNVAANKDCNLMIFNYDGEQLTQLYPNEFQSSPFVKAGQTVEVGGEQCKFAFTAANPSSKASNEKIFVYAYPLESDSAPISIAMAPVPSSPFRAAEMTPEKYRELVNRSEVFFSRKVNVTARKTNEPEEVQLASFEKHAEPTAAPNKIELHLVIDPNKK